MQNLTQNYIKTLLAYDPLTGVFTWKVIRRGTARAGSVAGTLDGHGYLRITLNRKKYLAHRLAWLFVYGAWPEGEIDHRDKIKLNNRIENLRDVTHLVNMQNQTAAFSTNQSTGLIGAYRLSETKFRSLISVNGKRVHLGFFSTAMLAHCAYIEAKRRMHPEFVV